MPSICLSTADLFVHGKSTEFNSLKVLHHLRHSELADPFDEKHVYENVKRN